MATSGQPGQLALLDHLVAAGADLEARNGGALRGALYYQQDDAAARLVQQGARLDLIAAAGLGRVDLVDTFLTLGRDAIVGQAHLAHYSQISLPKDPTAVDYLSIALVHAARAGHVAVLQRLIDAGADLNRRPYFDHHATALHWAAIDNQLTAMSWLLTLGADRTICDSSFNSTPLGWAQHAGHQQAMDLLR